MFHKKNISNFSVYTQAMERVVLFVCIVTVVITLVWRNVGFSGFELSLAKKDTPPPAAGGSVEDRVAALEKKVQALESGSGAKKDDAKKNDKGDAKKDDKDGAKKDDKDGAKKDDKKAKDTKSGKASSDSDSDAK